MIGNANPQIPNTFADPDAALCQGTPRCSSATASRLLFHDEGFLFPSPGTTINANPLSPPSCRSRRGQRGGAAGPGRGRHGRHGLHVPVGGAVVERHPRRRRRRRLGPRPTGAPRPGHLRAELRVPLRVPRSRSGRSLPRLVTIITPLPYPPISLTHVAPTGRPHPAGGGVFARRAAARGRSGADGRAVGGADCRACRRTPLLPQGTARGGREGGAHLRETLTAECAGGARGRHASVAASEPCGLRPMRILIHTATRVRMPPAPTGRPGLRIVWRGHV